VWSICNRYASSRRMEALRKKIYLLRPNIPRRAAIEHMPARSSRLVIAGLLALISLFPISLGARPAEPPQYPFQNVQLPPEQRIADLISRLTSMRRFIASATDPSVPRLDGRYRSRGRSTWARAGWSRWLGREGKDHHSDHTISPGARAG
jgi:hypothetical protein